MQQSTTTSRNVEEGENNGDMEAGTAAADATTTKESGATQCSSDVLCLFAKGLPR